MANLRCFDTVNANNFTGSDYIQGVRRKTLFQNAQTIAIGNSSYQKGIETNSVSPGYHTKTNGSRYIGPVYVTPNTNLVDKYPFVDIFLCFLNLMTVKKFIDAQKK